MNHNHLVYFDNGATTFPKPKIMYDSMINSMVFRGGNPGRSGHRLSVGAARDIYRLREKAAEFFGCSLPEHVILTFNTTHALNIAIKSVLCDGDTVLYSDMEHNAVYRPIMSVAEHKKVIPICFKTYSDPDLTLESIKNCCKESKPKAIVCVHSSNVCPRKLPIAQIGEYCKNNGIYFIVDGAQSGGHDIIKFDPWGIDALCLPGHKGLYGPAGTGLMIVSKKLAEYIKDKPTLIDGGNGVDSINPTMPQSLPERFEAGTMPSYLFAGLSASLEYLDNIGVDRIRNKENKLFSSLMDILRANKMVKVYLSEYNEGNVISFNIKNLSPWQTADYFDKQGICMRSGLHCSPLAHKTLGSLDEGGTVRISLGIFNDERDVNRFFKALKQITN